jgi:isocitrate dehydrogenase
MNKIQVKTPIVEIDGDEMTRVLWQLVKDNLLVPDRDMKREYSISN